jgi:hypothetical protein
MQIKPPPAHALEGPGGVPRAGAMLLIFWAGIARNASLWISVAFCFCRASPLQPAPLFHLEIQADATD